MAADDSSHIRLPTTPSPERDVRTARLQMLAHPRVSAPEFCRRHRLTSFYGVPIILDEALLGVLALTGRTPFRFSSDDLELLESVTAQGAVAIRNARLYKELERRLHETETL